MMKNFIEDPSVRYSISEIIDAAMTQYPVTFPYPDFNLTEQFGLEEYFGVSFWLKICDSSYYNQMC